jgi:membrane protein YdbS with pleckstrin-like domain
MLGVQIRPTLKFVRLSYVACLLVAVALGVYILAVPMPPDPNKIDPRLWGFVPLAIWLFFTMVRHIKQRLVKIIILGDRLRYEKGLFSKSTENIELVKVQDVRVNQTLLQRMFNIGNLSFETAGGSSRREIYSIDNPQNAADHILSLARDQRVRPETAPGEGSGPAANADAV